jgi:hypothetical protein
VLEGLLKDEPGLGHRPLGGVHQEEHAVRHRQHPLHLAAEVGVAGGVDQVDLHDLPGGGVGVVDGDVLGEDRDAPLALQGVGVEEGVLRHLALAEVAALAQQGVDEGGLAVVDVGDDRHVSDVVAYLVHQFLNATSGSKVLGNNWFGQSEGAVRY